MDSDEEYRINRLLSSVEREDGNADERPTGALVKTAVCR